ncbi:MAG: hypothetical protein RLZZ187_2647 [Pseudomonadota bacterium]|jgi:hypothetical protein
MRGAVLTMLVLLLGACTAEQAYNAAQFHCRAFPNTCTDPNAIPASRSPGL